MPCLDFNCKPSLTQIQNEIWLAIQNTFTDVKQAIAREEQFFDSVVSKLT